MPKNTHQSFTGRLKSFVASEKWFRLVILFFVLEAAWIALSGRYPMAFDEDFHLGIIRLYANHISPFWSGHPAGSDAFGAVARDPSYLYQWLMSFPYRLISALTNNQTSQVIFLRFISIGLFGWGLFLYRKLLLKTGASRSLVHFCLAIFILIPITPLLAAQINYDNLLLPLSALFLLLTLDFTGAFTKRQPLDGRLLLTLVSLGLLISLIKYAFLPVLLAAAVFVIVRFWQIRPAHKLKMPSKLTTYLLSALLLVSFGLFMQRYSVNIARYHKPVPSCDEVLSVDQCSAYGPWNRDHKYAQMKPATASSSPLVFTADWFYGMWFRTFFAVDGPATTFATRGPFAVPAISAIIFSLSALLATVIVWKRIGRHYNHHVLLLFILVAAIYTTALWVDEYHSFVQTGQPVALNGRYLIPIYPLLLVILALGANTYLKSRVQAKVFLAGAVLICMLWGGGALTYILRSYDIWYWPNSTVINVNHAVQKTIGPLVPGNSDPTAFMGHHGT